MRKRILVFIYILFSVISIFASAIEYKTYIKSDGNSLKYRNTNIEVEIPKEYIYRENDFRACWVSHLVGDFPSYSNVNQYKNEVIKVLDTMKYYNMNAIIFHIRTHNNALYKSELNPVASYYSKVDFDVFDPLEFIISESHKRGIEFHAWMNPYRLSTTYSGSVEQYAASQPAYNIASNPDLILKSGSNLILNPGEPSVREFLIDTVMEVLENYNVDAIHFDDYFYISGVDDSTTRNKYNQENLSLDNFRRKQVDLFIEQLHNAIRRFNILNNKIVQLGISPSGIYRNGGYVPLENYKYDDEGSLTYPVYSNSSGFSHYDAYLFSDTKKWIDEEWIDYIIPQTYWSFEHPVAGYADLMDWWNMVVKNKNVNLYSGMGLYMAWSTNTYGWENNVEEALNQAIYSSNLENVSGHCIFSYKHIKAAYDNPTRDNLTKSFTKLKEKAWEKYALLPIISSYADVLLPGVNNLKVDKIDNKNIISFDKLNGAKFYALYRDKQEVTFDVDQIIDVFGSEEEIVSYIDNDGADYVYGIRPISNTNTLGNGITSDGINSVYNIDFYVDNNLLISYKSSDEFTIPQIPAKTGYDQVNPIWTRTDFSNINKNIRVDAVYSINKYTVEFYDKNGILVDSQVVDYGSNIVGPDVVDIIGFRFIGWDNDLNNIMENMVVYGIYEELYFIVNFYDKDGKFIDSTRVPHNGMARAPKPPVVAGYKFKEWDTSFAKVESDLEVRAIYEADNTSIISCQGFNLGYVLFASLGFSLLMFIRRKK